MNMANSHSLKINLWPKYGHVELYGHNYGYNNAIMAIIDSKVTNCGL